jgi:hypothetical protein
VHQAHCLAEETAAPVGGHITGVHGLPPMAPYIDSNRRASRLGDLKLGQLIYRSE